MRILYYTYERRKETVFVVIKFICLLNFILRPNKIVRLFTIIQFTRNQFSRHFSNADDTYRHRNLKCRLVFMRMMAAAAGGTLCGCNSCELFVFSCLNNMV